MSGTRHRAGALSHGGRIAAARRRFPGAPEPLLDLSTGINPHAYPLPSLAPEAWTRLPDEAEELLLIAAAARAYGCPTPGAIVAAPGTQALIGLIPRLVARGEVRVLGPTYGEHAQAWAEAGHAVREVGDPAALAGDVAVLCNPNNPDGRRHAPEALRALAARCRLLVVDEAFADLEPAPLSLAGDTISERVVVLRSFGKTYGLAGLRLGFAITGEAFAARLRAALGPWAVSGPALAIGAAALADEAWRQGMARRLAGDVARLDALLGAVGLEVIGGTLLFRLVRTVDAAGLVVALGREGIVVRDFAEAARWARFGVPGTEMAWGRVEAGLQGWRRR